MAFLKKENKLEIYRAIVSIGFFDKLYNAQQTMDFLSSIWELRLLPSTDPRFNDLSGDIQHHIINNDDWDLDTLFIEKLSLLKDDDKFQKFIERIVSIDYNDNESDSRILVDAINELLNKERYELAIYNYADNGRPIYLVTQTAGSGTSTDFPSNTITFFIDKNPDGYSHKISSHKKPTQYPAFILVADGWDDFGVESTFDLFYYTDTVNISHIGSVKIIHKTEMTPSEMESNRYKSKNYLPDKFEVLSNEFCSLGQRQEYYSKIKRLFPLNYKSIFWALQDCAIFSEIEDNYLNHNQFHSLIRENEVEQLLRQEKYIIEGQNVNYRYHFSYNFTPKYTTNDTISIDFKFDKEGLLANRIYAVIGENGVGKTQLITTLPLDIANKKNELFSPHIPIFSKIIAVSNSFYDNFTIPKPTASFNYVYCGLSKLVKGEKEILTPLALKQRLHKACKAIQKKERIKSLKKILNNILSEDIIDELFKIEIKEDTEIITFQYDNLAPICNKISSGQSTLIYVFCDIVSNIRYDSLLLFDEPETHLHPNAITALITAIYELLEEYQSYSIISTHSPLIIRELLSRSVYIMERNANYPSIKKIGLESFGENLTTLTEEIFGNKEVPKFYKKKINELVHEDYSYDEIAKLLRTNNIPLSLNLTIFIKNLIESRNEKN